MREREREDRTAASFDRGSTKRLWTVIKFVQTSMTEDIAHMVSLRYMFALLDNILSADVLLRFLRKSWTELRTYDQYKLISGV